MNSTTMLYFDNIPTLKLLTKKAIIKNIIIGKIKWKSIKNSKVLPNELLEYIANNYETYIYPNTCEAVEIFELRGHTKSVSCSHIDGKYVITGSYDKTARIWDLVTLKCISILHHDDTISNVYLDIKSQLIVTVTSKNVLFFWDINEIPKIIESITFSESIMEIMKIERDGYIALRVKKKVYILDTLSFKISYEIPVHLFNIIKDIREFSLNIEIEAAEEFVNDISNQISKTLNIDEAKIKDISTTIQNNLSFIFKRNATIYYNGTMRTFSIEEIPLLIRGIGDIFILLAQINNRSYKLYYYEGKTNKSGSYILPILPLISPYEYNVNEMEIINFDEYLFVLVKIYVSKINLLFWMITEIPKTHNNIEIFYSLSKPIFGKHQIALVSFDVHKISWIVSGILDSIPYARSYDDGIVCCNHNLNKQKNSTKKFYVYRLSYNSTLEQSLLFQKIIKYHHKNEVIRYKDEYMNVLMNMEKGVYLLLLHQFKDTLCSYIPHHLKVKSIEIFSKPIKNLSYGELCKLYGYDNVKICC